MPWLLIVHIAALLCWCGSLLYLPALIVSLARREAEGQHDLYGVTRGVFTFVSTPAALVAIISGTALFLTDHTIAGWLVVKLTLVSGLVICHVLTGRLILYVEESSRKHERLYSVLLGIMSLTFISGILWLVLAKPF